MKINKIIKLSDSISSAVNILNHFSYRDPEGNVQKIKGYLPNKSSRDIVKSILLSCPESTDKKLHLLTASYGTGKSYLLLMLANILSNQNKKAMDSLVEKIKDKEDFYKDKLSATLDNHINNSDPFLVVIPEYGDTDFNHALLEGLKNALRNNKIEYVPNTNYELAIKTINDWKVKNPENYNRLKDIITNNTIEKFIEQLKVYNLNTYNDFKRYFEEISCVPYPESYTSAYPIFADTAKEIRKSGFRGIAIIYDEFGEMLGKLINSSSSATGGAVQEFLEDVTYKRDHCNIVFISASHQDPQSLSANKEKQLNKIIGRFERHQLIVSEAEGEEIMGTIFIKEDQNEFASLYKHALFQEHLETIHDFKLYPNQQNSWIETKVLKNLYPLHPLTSYILPRLSAEFAQNTRSMFNFLSPRETHEGAFRYFIESKNVIDNGKLNLYTPDLLLDFFIKNIREDKEGRVQSLYEVYRVGIGKDNDANYQSIIKNLFLLWVVSIASIKPNKETLFWAMNWEESRRNEFYNLLDDLVGAKEYLELNPTDKTYQFPDFGAAPLSKIIDEEIKKLDDLTLAQCLVIWNDLNENEDLQMRDHNNRFGCNRKFCIKATNDGSQIISCIKDIENYYNNNSAYLGNGYLFYLVGRSDDEIEELKIAIKRKPTLLQYIVFATPINLPQFDNLMKETLHFKAIQKTAGRPDVIQNPARLKSIQDQLRIANSHLSIKIKTLYEPSNWKWNYLQENDIEISTKLKFSNWINQKTDMLFSETPKINDEALWFTEGSKGATYRKQALRTIFTAEKDRIILRDESNNSADQRIVKAFFANIGLTIDRKRDKTIQYGEIKMPDQESQVNKAWKHIENELKLGSYINTLSIIKPLLHAPFGLSEHIIKFLLASYIRYNSERIIIADKKKNPVQISLDIIENLTYKTEDYFIRKIEITGPELRYLNQLRTLFDKRDVNTWMDLTQKFIGIVQYFTPLHKGIIKESGDNTLQLFYESLETLKTEFQSTGSDKEKISQDYFLEYIPSLLYNEGSSLLEDSTKVSALVSKLDEFKKFPFEEEASRKMDVILTLSKEVFGKNIGIKSEINEVVLDWFKSLPAPNQSGKFGNEIISKWLFEIKNTITNDPFELYLVKLNEIPFKDWGEFSYEKYSFIGRFKEYKRTVEEYTKSPLEVLQIIARGVFEKPSSECDSEQTFDGYFKDWWHNLPDLNKAEQYSPETNLFISQISIPSAVKARYLETIPQSWQRFNFLPAYIPTQWEGWSNIDANTVGEKYQKCIQEVISWRPPIEEEQLYISLGKLFFFPEANSLISLYAIVNNWKEGLPERTKHANWEKINLHASKFLSALSDQDNFGSFITKEILTIWKLPEFKKWNENVLATYLQKFESLKIYIEEYKRPLFELVEKIEVKTKEKSSTAEAFCFNLISRIKDSEAFKNRINSELLDNPISVILYDAFSKNVNNFNFDNIIPPISTELGITSEWHMWSVTEEKSFITILSKGIDNLIKWKFPEAEKLKKAKVKVKHSIAILKKELSLDDVQMRKVLNDIIEEK